MQIKNIFILMMFYGEFSSAMQPSKPQSEQGPRSTRKFCSNASSCGISSRSPQKTDSSDSFHLPIIRSDAYHRPPHHFQGKNIFNHHKTSDPQLHIPSKESLDLLEQQITSFSSIASRKNSLLALLNGKQRGFIVTAIYDHEVRNACCEGCNDRAALIDEVQKIVKNQLPIEDIEILIKEHKEEAYDLYFDAVLNNAEALGGIMLVAEYIYLYSYHECKDSKFSCAFYKALAIRNINGIRSKFFTVDEDKKYRKAIKFRQNDQESFNKTLFKQRRKPQYEAIPEIVVKCLTPRPPAINSIKQLELAIKGISLMRKREKP